MRRAVFFDRDGTLNEEIGYVSDPDRIRLLPGAVEAVMAVRAAGMAAVIVTNQGGVGRGLMNEDQVRKVNARVIERLAEQGAVIDAVYYCPHHPKGTVQGYIYICACRKPAPGMVKLAAEDLDLDLPASFVIGDKTSDIELAWNAGARGILVQTGFGADEAALASERRIPLAYTAANVLDAVKWILAQSAGKGLPT